MLKLLTVPHFFVPKDTIPTRYFVSLKSVPFLENKGPPESPEQESSPVMFRWQKNIKINEKSVFCN